MSRLLLLTVLFMALCLSFPGNVHSTEGNRSIAKPGCEPVLPILTESVVSDHDSDGIRSCETIGSSADWTAFCSDNKLACENLDDSFFADWTIVAVVVETISPLLCENAGPVPWWQVSCLTRRNHRVQARVETTLAGAECQCSMAPQIPTVEYLVHAIPGDGATACTAWQEVHTIECVRR